MNSMKNLFGKKCLIFLFVCCVAIVVLYQMCVQDVNGNVRQILQVQSQMSNSTCLKKYFQRGIDKLQHNINMLQKYSNNECSSVYRKFSAMYEVDVYNSSQILGQAFSKKMFSWLGNNIAMLKLADFQTIFVVHDILRQKSTAFNPLRSMRPVSKSQSSLVSYLKNISESSKINCDFCKPFNMTARDIFGRIQGNHSVSASNAFKLGKWHGLFIPYEHSIFNIDMNIFLDVFNTSLKWFKKVHSVDKYSKYPVLFWDVFPHAGASQIHVHVHGIVGEEHYPGQFQDMLNTVHTFQQGQDSHYWDAIVEVHESLGLTLRFGKSIAIAPLVPIREHELWLLSNEPSSEFFVLLYSVIKMYQVNMNKYCFSMAGALPALDKKQHNLEQSLPSIILIGTRGDCSSLVSDVSSLELYLFNNVNTDPYNTIDALEEYLRLSTSKFNVENEMENLWNDTPLDQ